MLKTADAEKSGVRGQPVLHNEFHTKALYGNVHGNVTPNNQRASRKDLNWPLNAKSWMAYSTGVFRLNTKAQRTSSSLCMEKPGGQNGGNENTGTNLRK